MMSRPGWWIIPIIVVQVSDTATTLLGGFEHEGNPVMAAVGPRGMVVLKILGVLYFYLVDLRVRDVSVQSYRGATRVFNALMASAILLYLAVSIWNVYAIR